MFMQTISQSDKHGNVVVIGGCHVTGWLIGDSPPFWHDAADSWNGGLMTSCHGPTSLRKSIKLMEQRDIDCENALLIIQLGNFEASDFSVVSPLMKPILSKFNKMPATTEAVAPVVPKMTTPQLSAKQKLVIATKGAVLLGLELTVPPSMRSKAAANLSGMFRDLFDRVQDRDPRRVVVLSTFPTASPVMNFYRRKLNAVIRRLAESRSFTYIDAFDALKQAPKEGALFADGFHLSALGHSIIAAEIRKTLH